MSRKTITIAEAATALGLEAAGRTELSVSGVATPETAGPDDLALAMDPKYVPAVERGSARAAVLPPETDYAALGLEAALFAPRARYAMAGVTALFARPRRIAAGAHPSAIIDPTARIDATAAIGPLCVVEAGAEIGPGALLFGQATIGEEARIGAETVLHAGVRIGHEVVIGARCVIHPNAVIGADGFSFVTPEKGSVESAKATGAVAEGAENVHWARISSLGAVLIGDDVEIGAAATIDRGTIADTVIEAGAKIDNLVQIGHNVSIGENALLCGQSGVAGSSKLGARVVLGGQSGVGDHSMVGEDALVMAASGLSGVVRPRTVVGGTPAIVREELGKQILALRRLPRALEDLAELKNCFSPKEPSG